MKTIKKQIIKISGIILAAALFFSCDNPTTPVLPQNQSTENLTPPSNPPSTPPTNPATPASPAGSGAANSSGTSATLNPETLPDNVGTDPFAGNTYRINYLNNHYTEYTFGNDGTLIYMENEGGRKYQYTYNSNNKELSRRQIEEYHNDCNSAYAWRTYDQIVELYNNWTYSNYLSSNTSSQIMSEQEFIQEKERYLAGERLQFEKVFINKAEEDSSHNLKLRLDYHKTEPTTLPCQKDLQFYDSGNQTCITINSSTRNSGFGTITRVQHHFIITNITSDTITAAEAEINQSNGVINYTLVNGGTQLQITYSNLGLGDDNNLVITLTNADTNSSSAFESVFGSGNTSITLSTTTGFQTFTKQ